MRPLELIKKIKISTVIKKLWAIANKHTYYREKKTCLKVFFAAFLLLCYSNNEQSKKIITFYY